MPADEKDWMYAVVWTKYSWLFLESSVPMETTDRGIDQRTVLCPWKRLMGALTRGCTISEKIGRLCCKRLKNSGMLVLQNPVFTGPDLTIPSTSFEGKNPSTVKPPLRPSTPLGSACADDLTWDTIWKESYVLSDWTGDGFPRTGSITRPSLSLFLNISVKCLRELKEQELHAHVYYFLYSLSFDGWAEHLLNYFYDVLLFFPVG